jgi:hypothetical protein
MMPRQPLLAENGANSCGRSPEDESEGDAECYPSLGRVLLLMGV